MKIYSIALFLLCLNVCLGVVQSEPLFNANLENSPPIYIGGVNDPTSMDAFNSSQPPGLPTDQNDIFSSLLAIPTLIWNQIFGLPALLSSIGLPDTFCMLMCGILIVVYTIGLAQLISGRYLTFAE